MALRFRESAAAGAAVSSCYLFAFLVFYCRVWYPTLQTPKTLEKTRAQPSPGSGSTPSKESLAWSKQRENKQQSWRAFHLGVSSLRSEVNIATCALALDVIGVGNWGLEKCTAVTMYYFKIAFIRWDFLTVIVDRLMKANRCCVRLAYSPSLCPLVALKHLSLRKYADLFWLLMTF